VKPNLARFVAIFAFAFFACSLAFADPVDACKPKSASDIRVGVTIAPTGNAYGAWAWWWCMDIPKARVYYSWRAIPSNLLTTSVIAQLRAYSTGGSADIWLQPVAVADTDPSMLAMLADIKKSVAADTGKPTLPKWVVSSSGLVSGATTRPTYPIVLGKRSTTAKGSVAVGSGCDCNALKLTEGSTMYCQTTAGFVAVCTAAPTPPPVIAVVPSLVSSLTPPLALENLPNTTKAPVSAPISWKLTPMIPATVQCRLVRGPSPTASGVAYPFGPECPQPFTISAQPIGKHRVDFLITTATSVQQKTWSWEVLAP